MRLFSLSYCVSTSNPIPNQSCPSILKVVCPSVNAHFHLSPGNPVFIDIDAAWRKATLLITCYCCRKARHKAPDCELHFDIHTCIVDELQGFLEDKLAALDVVTEEDNVAVEEDKPKVQDFAICNE